MDTVSTPKSSNTSATLLQISSAVLSATSNAPSFASSCRSLGEFFGGPSGVSSGVESITQPGGPSIAPANESCFSIFCAF